MATIVGLASIVTQKAHGVIFRNMLGMRLHELLGAVPQRWNGLHVFVQTQHETVLLLVIGHKFEDIIVDVAEKLDAWLNTPVPFVIHHQWLTEEEARFESAHMTVADRVSIDDLPLSHILPNLAGFLLINVLWERPMFLGDLSIVSGARYQ